PTTAGLKTFPSSPGREHCSNTGEPITTAIHPTHAASPTPTRGRLEPPYGFEIVEFRDIQRVIIFDIGGPQGFRTIYMDGRTHPRGPDLIPTYDGHSVRLVGR